MATEEKTASLGIPVSEVEIMVQTFYDYEKKHPDFDPAKHVKSVWFPKDKLAEMAQALTDEKGDGVRIYFGRYPTDVSGFEDPIPTPNTNSVIFVSTYADGDYHIDYFTDVHPFDPENRGEQCQPHCGGAKIVAN